MSENYRHGLGTDAITVVKMRKMFLLPVEVLSFYKTRLEEKNKCWEPDWEKKAATLFLRLWNVCCSTEIWSTALI